jgi:amidohydrolase
VLLVDKPSAQAEALAQKLHAEPEVSLCEVRSAERCCQLLESWGFDVTRGVAGLDTAFVAEHPVGTGTGAVVGLVAEYDALPVVGHGCGHHLIAGAVLEAAGRLIADEATGEGTIRVLGTPGEELFAGKAAMLKAGAFEGVEAVVTYHPFDQVGVFRRLTGTAIYDLTFHGSSAHAATSPWLGRSAQDGALIAAEALAMERQYLRDGSRIHALLTEVLGAHNVLPERAVLQVNVRAITRDELALLDARVHAIAEGSARATSTQVDVKLVRTAQPYQMHAGLARLACQVMGIREDSYCDLGGSTDLGDVSVALPTVTVTETGWDATPWHSRELHNAAGTASAYASMHRAADVMVAIADRLFADAPWK